MSAAKHTQSVLVCRAKTQLSNLCCELENAGFNPLPFALIDIIPDHAAIAQLPQQASKVDWIIFISPSAVDLAYPHIQNSSAKFATIGQPSAKRLQEKCSRDVVCPTLGNDSQQLLQQAKFNIRERQKVLIIGGQHDRQDLFAALLAKGAQVAYAQIYRRAEIQANWRAFDAAQNNDLLYAACVTTAQIATLLFQQAGQSRIATLQSLAYCVPHERVAESLIQAGAHNIMISRSGDRAMVGALCQRLKT